MVKWGALSLVVATLVVVGFALYPGAQTVGFAAYLLLFLLASLIASASSKRSGLVAAVSVGLLVGAALQSIVGCFQLLDWGLFGAVLKRIYQQTYGNLGQPNHYAALLSFGLIAAIFLAARWRWWVMSLVVLWFGFLISTTASRASWLYSAAIVLLGFVASRSQERETRSAGFRAISAGFGILMSQVLFSYCGVLERLGVTSSIARVADAGSNSQRLYDWSLAVSAIKAHPWSGVGVGRFHGWAIEQMALTPSVPFSKFAEHAHNLPLHLAATVGLPCALLTLGLTSWWLIRQLRVPMTPERLFALCGLSVIGLHSMVEYPLWYSYFIIPAGLFCGILSATDPRARSLALPAWLGNAFGALFIAVLIWVAHDYVVVERAYSDWSSLRDRTPDAERERIRASLAGVTNWSIVADHARSLELQLWRPERESAAGVAQQCEPAFKMRPSWGLGTQCLLAMGMAGDRAGVARMSLVLCEGFPRHHQMLREWAEAADGYRPIVSVQSENCLRKQ